MNENVREVVARNIKNLLEKRDMSMNKLSTFSYVNYSTLWAIVNCKRNPSQDTMIDIADALGVKLYELYKE